MATLQLEISSAWPFPSVNRVVDHPYLHLMFSLVLSLSPSYLLLLLLLLLSTPPSPPTYSSSLLTASASPPFIHHHHPPPHPHPHHVILQKNYSKD